MIRRLPIFTLPHNFFYFQFYSNIQFDSKFISSFNFVRKIGFFFYCSQHRRDHANARIPRSSSIDSMVEAVWSETSRPSLTLSPPPQASQPTPQYLQINYGNTGSISRRESLLSPSAGRRAKQQRYIAGK